MMEGPKFGEKRLGWTWVGSASLESFERGRDHLISPNDRLSSRGINFCLVVLSCAGSWLLFELFSSCSEQGLLCAVVHELLIAVASLMRSTGSRHTGFRSCSSQNLDHGLSCGTQA